MTLDLFTVGEDILCALEPIIAPGPDVCFVSWKRMDYVYLSEKRHQSQHEGRHLKLNLNGIDRIYRKAAA